MKEILKNIKSSFNHRVAIEKKRENIYQVFLPIYHEDGDMIELFVTQKGDEFLLSDYGLTLQKLSYSYDIDTENKEAILQRILSENGLSENDGNISMPTKPETIFTDIMHITQTFAKIGSMRFFRKAVIERLFMEQLAEYINTDLTQFKPESRVSPIASRKELTVDFKFQPNGHPVYLFGVKDNDTARLATISILEFLRSKLNFVSVIVNEDFDKLSKRDRLLLINAADKQFTSLDEFKERGKEWFERQVVN